MVMLALDYMTPAGICVLITAYSLIVYLIYLVWTFLRNMKLLFRLIINLIIAFAFYAPITYVVAQMNIEDFEEDVNFIYDSVEYVWISIPRYSLMIPSLCVLMKTTF